MTNAKSSSLPALAQLFRPAIAEARLMSDKRAHDPAYVAALVQELTNIEGKISALERSLHTDPTRTSAQTRPCRTRDHAADAKSVRELSSDLYCRLRRLEQEVQAEPATTQSRRRG